MLATACPRVLQLTFLAPDLIEGVLDGRLGQEFGLEQLRDTIPVDWGEQRRRFR